MSSSSGESVRSRADASAALRAIPSVDDLARHPVLAAWLERLPRSVVVEAARRAIEQRRERILAGGGGDGAACAAEPNSEAAAAALAAAVAADLKQQALPPLRPAINATGIIIHTGLGRAPLADEAVAALADAARQYAPVELDMPSGERGLRSLVVRELLCALSGAESGTVVNNNAAALLITLGTVVRPEAREVIVSRGELIEIGGSFRLPEVMEQSGAILREVGTTNRTRVADFKGACNERTAAILKVHPSNYRVVGFTESPGVRDLAELARERGLPLVHDIGSGVLRPMRDFGLGDEPDAQTSIAEGADLVLFSGDKLLGGPQAGIIVGRKPLISRIERNPLMRALRVDKLTLSALAATLQLHRDPAYAAVRVPVLRMMQMPLDALRQRAEAMAAALGAMADVQAAEVVDGEAYLGGGSLPAQAIASIAMRVRARNIDEAELARRLRTAESPILPRLQQGWVVFDLRTIFPEQDESIISAVQQAIAEG